MTLPRHRGRYLEDFRVGDEIRTSERIVTARDVADFAALTGDDNPLHRDGGGAGGHARPMVHGLLGFGIAVGLVEQTGVLDGTSLAMVRIQRWDFRRPMVVGDRVHAVMSVAAVWPSRRDPGRGTVVRHLALRDEREAILQEGVMTLLVRARDGHAGSRRSAG